MNHSTDNEKQCIAKVGSAVIYVTDYSVTCDRRHNFHNTTQSQLTLTDNGVYPAYLKIKGYVLKSECPSAGATLWNLIDNNARLDLIIEKTNFHELRIKNFSVDTNVDSQAVNCEIMFLCSAYLSAEV